MNARHLAERAEVLKYLALACMLLDHVDAWLLDRSVPWLHAVGRLALPLFCFCLGVGIAVRRDFDSALRRLLSWGCVCLVLQLLVRELLPLNVLFTLAGGVTIAAWLLDTSRPALPSLGLGLLLAGLSEFGPFGVALAAACVVWGCVRTWQAFVPVVGALLLLTIPNGGPWALAALVPLACLPWLPPVRRLPGAFYRAYAGQFVGFGVLRLL